MKYTTSVSLFYAFFTVPHYEVVKIHSVRHTVSKRSIKSNPYNAKDTSNSNFHHQFSDAKTNQENQESRYDGNHKFSSYNRYHNSENVTSITPSDSGITDVRWESINGSFYPSTRTSSSLPSNSSPHISRTSSPHIDSSQSTRNKLLIN